MNKTKPILLVLGAGRGQVGLIRSAKKYGCEVIVATQKNRKFPGIDLADHILEVDISDPASVLSATSGLHIDGVATTCIDTPLPSLGALVDSRNLVGLSQSASSKCLNKLAMKEALVAHEVATSAFVSLSEKEDLTRAEALGYPFVLKALDLQGSNGVFIVNNRVEAETAYSAVLQKTRQNVVIAESYIDGKEFGAQAFIYHDEVVFVMEHGDTLYHGASTVPIGHYVPWGGSEAMAGKAANVVKQAIGALGLNNCAVNVDLMESEGNVYVLELTGRAGANALPEIVSIATGIDYYSMIVAMALGEDPRQIWNRRNSKYLAVAAGMMMPPNRSGKVVSLTTDMPALSLMEGHVDEITYFSQVGDRIDGFRSSADCVGQIIASAERLEDAQQLLAYALASVRITVEE